VTSEEETRITYDEFSKVHLKIGKVIHAELLTILVTYPNVKNQSQTNDSNRPILTGTIDEIGRDIRQIKDIGVDHIVFGYNFVPIGRDVNKMISVSKELSKYAR
jgi:hypothetical protein